MQTTIREDEVLITIKLEPVMNETSKHALVLIQIPLHPQNQQFAARMQSVNVSQTEWIGEKLRVLPVQEHFVQEKPHLPVLSMQMPVLQQRNNDSPWRIAEVVSQIKYLEWLQNLPKLVEHQDQKVMMKL